MAMTELGARPRAMRAAVGPCIAQASYEVGPDLLAPVRRRGPGERRACSRRSRAPIACCSTSRAMCCAASPPPASPERTALPDDTLADEARFFSARRTRRQGGERFGLLLSAIALIE